MSDEKNDNGASPEATTVGTSPAPSERTFTQEDVNRIVADRLSRERAKQVPQVKPQVQVQQQQPPQPPAPVKPDQSAADAIARLEYLEKRNAFRDAFDASGLNPGVRDAVEMGAMNLPADQIAEYVDRMKGAFPASPESNNPPPTVPEGAPPEARANLNPPTPVPPSVREPSIIGMTLEEMGRLSDDELIGVWEKDMRHSGTIAGVPWGGKPRS